MDIDDRAIAHEFRRQIYLCSGLGLAEMQELLADAWARGVDGYPCRDCGKQGSFLHGHICPERDRP